MWWKDGKGSSRPPSRPGVGATRPKSAKGGAGQRAGDRRLGDSRTPFRPSSAPALLRNENFPQRSTHKDRFLQGIEDWSVKRNKGRLGTERFPLKDFITSVDALQDPYLHDLLVMHNRSQRESQKRRSDSARGEKHRRDNLCGASAEDNNRGASNRHRKAVSESRAQARGASPQPPKPRKTQSGSLGLSALAGTLTDQVKELCEMLDGSIQQHCVSQGVPEHLGIYVPPQVTQSSTAFVKENLRGFWQQN
mmetsp:Transcript_105325/g.186539  ORF Transcript_105325/g.186539 Transcript_105325/m.186539 type:complete len:250 (-) Transcript_105325:88-837(-)